MTASAKAKKKWAYQRLKNAMQQYQAIMEPHIDLMESTNGQLSMLMVQLAALRNAPPAELAEIVRHGSIKSGIPEDALEAHARFFHEMVKCFEFDQHLSKCALAGKGNEE
jgi:hypothetical protein